MTVVRGNKGVGRAIGGAAAPTASIAPIPLNTPSVKRENNGRDPSVNLLPSRNAGIWGQGGEDGNGEPRYASQTAPIAPKPAPWAKPAASTEQSTEAASKPAAATRNWADVDVDSDEDDDSPHSAPAPSHAFLPQPSSSTAAQGMQWAPTETSHPSFGLGSASFGQSQGQGPAGASDSGYRKDRSGSGSFNDSFGGGDQRRFGGFGSTPYGGNQQEDGRFGSRPFGSSDARFGGPSQGPGDFQVSFHTALHCYIFDHSIESCGVYGVLLSRFLFCCSGLLLELPAIPTPPASGA